jgi:hypothetical protein
LRFLPTSTSDYESLSSLGACFNDEARALTGSDAVGLTGYADTFTDLLAVTTFCSS